jgi:hypothetical protein
MGITEIMKANDSKMRKDSSEEMVPDTKDMERNDEEDGYTSSKKKMSISKDELRETLKEIEDERQLRWVVEGKNEEQLCIIEKLIVERRVELEKCCDGDKKSTSDSVPAPSKY